MKRIITLILALVFLFSLVSCKGEEGPRPAIGGLHTKDGDLYPAEFLTFDETKVEFDLFRYYYLNYKNMYLEENDAYFEAEGAEEQLKTEIMDVMLDFYAIRFLAEENNVRLNKTDRKSVNADIEKTVEFYNGKEEFLEFLEESFMTEELYVYMMEYSAIYLKLFNKLYKDGGKLEWSDEKFFTYYDQNYLAAQQIFLPFEEGETKENHPKTMELANGLYQRAVGGEDFWELVKAHGKDDNMLDYPDGYYFTKGQAEDALYEATAALKKGDVSKPVAGETGLYIIRRMEMKELRMKENRETTLYGYTDSMNEWHAGAYDAEFQEHYQARAKKIKIEKSDYWNEVSTKTVY